MAGRRKPARSQPGVFLIAICDAATRPLEIWAGPECTICRVGDGWRDQAVETGHRERLADLDLIADLGIRTVRYPLLWESIAPERPDELDFSWSDQRIARLEKLGIEVIGGLLHHGSGPRYTDLLDPDFPTKLADFARRVAQRYPHIQAWTPVNEPLTTARFSALYGHWHPHRRDYPAFLRALVNQSRATAVAMAAIRAVNPAARLIQTEDLGKVHAKATLRDQAAHENERRWLSLDLLAGRVGPEHPFHPHLVEAGIMPGELAELKEAGAVPDLIGINYYLTSERFLDPRLHLYHGLEPGGNGREAYVDVEAVRVTELAGQIGLDHRLREAWERYSIPLAVTEVHHGCTREEQLRWLTEVRDTAERVRDEGVDLRAITPWSLFGNFDWRSLITREDGDYDVGAFDIRSPTPRPTAVAAAIRSMAAEVSFDHPVLDTPGWWRRPGRFYGWCDQPAPSEADEGRTLLIIGATGTLGAALARICAWRGLSCRLVSRAEMDIRDSRAVAAALDRHLPWAVINAAGFVRVADAERERAACFASNTAGAGFLAGACAARNLPFVTFSTDLVFDGTAGRPYRETDLVCPTGAYGASKAAAERAVIEAGGKALIVRTSAFFGPWDVQNFAWHVLSSLRRGEPFRASSVTSVSPTFVPDLCHAVLDLLIDGETGIWHLANQSEVSWHGFARMIAEGAGLDSRMIHDEGQAARGTRSTALESERGSVMRALAPAVDAYLRDVAIAEPILLAAE
ncbi:MAG: family 1 glycosylhydrolase [Allosphingosinicella sp.]